MGYTILILRIIIIILSGVSAIDAVTQVSNESGVSFSILWELLDDIYK